MDAKGTSEEAKNFGAQVRDRFIEFFSERGIKAVSDKTGCNEQVFRNCLNGTRPAIDTLCQVKLAYGDEFDINYLFTGDRSSQVQSEPDVEDESQIENLGKQLSVLQEKLNEREQQIKELKEDKAFLQSLIKKQ